MRIRSIPPGNPVPVDWIPDCPVDESSVLRNHLVPTGGAGQAKFVFAAQR